MVTFEMAFAQAKIQFRSADRAECIKSDMASLKASFSFSTMEANSVATQKGSFSWLSMPNTVIGGNEGDPQIPVVNELIAVPFGAQPIIRVTSYCSTDYNLNDLGIETLIPRQPSLRKDKRPEDVPFVYNEAAYQTRGMRSEPKAMVSVVGTMRGVQLGKMTIEPVSYDPVSNTLRVFNDIEVEVTFDGADAKATENMLVETYSPYFNVVYKQLFNGKAVLDAYTEHPDLYTTPVKMLVVTTSTYANSTAFQNWLTWKKQKGIDVDVQTVANNASASTIKNLIYSRYNVNHPSFLVIVGDETVVTYYQLWDFDSNYGDAATDLEYASVDGDVYHDMFISRMPVSSTTELSNLVNKILTYEKYTMSDPSYLDETLLIAGWDESATEYIGKPTIQYASNYYFNNTHGINAHVFLTTGSGQTTCYNYINNVGFVNYTAHGDIQKWHDPQFTNNNVNSLTNTDKYFWAMGNCCLTANFKNAQNNQICFGETMVRVANKGAWGYIGSVPESLWYEDYYFAVGATNTFGQMPTQAQTTTGVYDALFDDTGFNSLNAVPYIGNVAVTYAHAGGYSSSVTDEYYWRAYQCFGDGSVMPYLKVPAANNVSHNSTILVGSASFMVSADAGSYVSITKNNEILGVAQVPSAGSVNVPISGLTTTGDVMIVVTRQQRQPYITTIQAIQNDGPYITLDSYTPNTALVGENTNLSITFRNAGITATSGNTTVTLTPGSNVTIVQGTKTFGSLAANAATTVSGFQFCINSGATVGSNVTIHYNAVNGTNNWEGDLTITADQVFNVTVAANNANYGTVNGGGQFHYNQSCTVTATPADGYMFVNWTQSNAVVSSDAQYTFNVTSAMNLVANFTEGVMIGSGTETNDILPAYNYYTNSLTEQIYTPSELGGAGLITSIAFFNGGAEKTMSYDFYMKATTKSTFTGKTDWITVTAGDKVFSGTVTMVADDWTTITFSTPFVYDGTSNVVLVTDKKTQWSNSPHMSCRVFNASSQALCIYNDSNDYNPLSPPTTSTSNNAVLSVKNQLVVTKETIPTGPFNITVSINPAQAGTVSGGGEYQYGETCTVTATPNSNFVFLGWTENGTVVSNELTYSFAAVADRDLVANFIYTIEIGEGTTTHNYLPSYSYYKQALTQQIYTTEEIGTAGILNGIAFYNEGAERTRTYDFYLKNTTKSSFSSKTDWITVAASDKVFSGVVTMTANAWTFIEFDTPFVYDGTSNIVFVADDNTGGYDNSPHMACSVFNTSSSQAIYSYDDNTNFNPLSPPTSAGSYNNVLSVKNHILFGITPTFKKDIAGYTAGNKDHYYLIASPVGDINPVEVGQMFVNSFDLYYFDQQSTQEWINYKAGTFNLVPGKGYLYANSANITLSFTGIPYYGDGQVALTFADGTMFEGWNLIGNPFAKTAQIDHAFYTMNTDGTDIIAGSGNVGAMEGVFVNATAANQKATFTPVAKSEAAQNSETASVVLNLNQNRGSIIDRAIIHFGNGNTLPKFQLFEGNTKLYIPQNGKDYAIVNSEDHGELPLNFKADRNGSYTLSIQIENATMGYLHLIDNKTGNDVDLLVSPSYTFDAKTTDYASRFKLVFATGEASDEHFAFFSNGNLIINNDGMATLQVIDINGRILSSESINGCHSTSLGVASGVYMLRLISDDSVKSQKIIVE